MSRSPRVLLSIACGECARLRVGMLAGARLLAARLHHLLQLAKLMPGMDLAHGSRQASNDHTLGFGATAEILDPLEQFAVGDACGCKEHVIRCHKIIHIQRLFQLGVVPIRRASGEVHELTLEVASQCTHGTGSNAPFRVAAIAEEFGRPAANST